MSYDNTREQEIERAYRARRLQTGIEAACAKVVGVAAPVRPPTEPNLDHLIAKAPEREQLQLDPQCAQDIANGAANGVKVVIANGGVRFPRK